MAPKVYPTIFNDRSSESPKMSLAYMNRVLEIITDHKDVRQTAVGVLKQTSITAVGSLAGGLLMGPVGALIGAVFGAGIAYKNAEDYDNLVTAINRMSDRDKEVLGAKVQQLVGALSIEEFVRWITTEGHRALLLGVLSDFAKGGSAQ